MAIQVSTTAGSNSISKCTLYYGPDFNTVTFSFQNTRQLGYFVWVSLCDTPWSCWSTQPILKTTILRVPESF